MGRIGIFLKYCPDSWESIEKRKASDDKQIRQIIESNREKARCTEEPGAVTEPEMEHTCRAFMVGLIAEMKR